MKKPFPPIFSWWKNTCGQKREVGGWNSNENQNLINTCSAFIQSGVCALLWWEIISVGHLREIKCFAWTQSIWCIAVRLGRVWTPGRAKCPAIRPIELVWKDFNFLCWSFSLRYNTELEENLKYFLFSICFGIRSIDHIDAQNWQMEIIFKG